MKVTIKQGVVKAIPIVIGYIPVAITFGILSKNTGITLLECILFSALVFGGASQFIALNLLGTGIGFGEIIVTTFLVNFRHFLMSTVLLTKLEDKSKRWLPILTFGVTDETFSVTTLQEGKLDSTFVLTIECVSYTSWVLGSVVGYLIEGVLPTIVSEAMGIALYAMFLAFLMPKIRKSMKVLIIALGAGMLNTLLEYLNWLSKGWNIIIAIMVVSSIGMLVTKTEQETNKEVVAYES